MAKLPKTYRVTKGKIVKITRRKDASARIRDKKNPRKKFVPRQLGD